MLFEKLADVAFNGVSWLLELLPNISWNVNEGAADTFFSLLEIVFYLLPMNTVIVLLNIVITIIAFKIGVSLIKTIWELLPIV